MGEASRSGRRSSTGDSVQIRRLSAGQRVTLAVEITRAYARVRWLMFRRELPMVVASLRSDGERQATLCPVVLEDGRMAAAVVRTLTKLPTDSRCLMRSLVLLSILARRGIPTRLIIGVSSDPFSAHAWVERDGIPILPNGGASFARLTEL